MSTNDRLRKIAKDGDMDYRDIIGLYLNLIILGYIFVDFYFGI